METFSALLAICGGNSPVPGEFPTQRPVARSFDVYFDLRPNKRLSKQSWGCWFETPSDPLWRHRNANPFHSPFRYAFVPRPSPEPVNAYCESSPWQQISVTFKLKRGYFHSLKPMEMSFVVAIFPGFIGYNKTLMTTYRNRIPESCLVLIVLYTHIKIEGVILFFFYIDTSVIAV